MEIQTAKFVLNREDRGIDPVTILTEGLVIGNLPDCDLHLNHPAVAEIHAGIIRMNGDFYITHLSKSNSTTLNGKLVEGRAAIADGDVVQIGPFILTLRRVGLALRIDVKYRSAAPAADGHAARPAEARPAEDGGGEDEGGDDAFEVFWNKRLREAGKIAKPSPLRPRDPAPWDHSIHTPGTHVLPAHGGRGPKLPREYLSKSVGLVLRAAARRLKARMAKSDPVDFTVFSPPAVGRGDCFMVQVFAHLPWQAQAADRMAKEFDAEATRRGYTRLEAEVRRGSNLTVHLSLPGLRVAEPLRQLRWHGDPHAVQFEAQVPDSAGARTVIGTVMVSKDQVPLGHVKFKLTVGEARAAGPAPGRSPAGESARLYRKAFISYASQDRAEVVKRVQMLSRLNIRFFQDLLDLEPGARWERQLYEHIDDCDLFLLFWSSAARQSQWVMKEVNYALGRKRQGGDMTPPEIVPVIIEGPPPPVPPPELAHLHFNDYLVYFMK